MRRPDGRLLSPAAEPHSPSARALASALLLSGAVVSGAAGCNFTQQGQPPRPRTVNFPIALALSGEAGQPADFLLVANSNFDLRFNAGSLMSIDLRELRSRMSADGCQTETCEIHDADGSLPEALVADEIAIGSHADDIAIAPDGDRLYLPIRSDRDLTFIDFDRATGALWCRQASRNEREPLPRCADEFRHAGSNDVTSERELVLAGDPVEVAVGRLEDVGGAPGDGDYLLVALRDGRMALYLDGGGLEVPTLVDIEEGFPEDLVSLAIQPGTGLGWVTSASTDELGRVGITLDPAVRARSFLHDAGRVRVGGVDDGEDIRDLAFHPTEPEAFLLSRRPESVIAVDLERRGLTAIDLGVRDVWEVGQGPSRLTLIEVGGATYVLASCFDAQRLFVIDADHGALVSVIGGFSGPFELAVDVASEHLYVVDFATSVIRVVDLAPLADNENPRLLATLGETFAPAEL